MAVTITGADWPTSGAASAGTTGLNAITGFTHVGSTDVPEGSLATGYLESTEGQAANIKLEATGTGCASDNTEYWRTLFVRGVRSGNNLPSGSTTAAESIGSPTQILLSFTQVTTNSPGFAFNLQVGTTADDAAGYVKRARYRDLSQAETMLGWGAWHKITIHIVRSSTIARYEVFCGKKLVEAINMDLNTNVVWANQTLQFALPAWSGVKWQVCAPITSVATANSIGLRPDYSIEGSGNYVTKIFEPFGVTSTAYTDGIDFVSSGTGTVAVDTEYLASGGQSPFRRRLSMSGSGNAPVATSVDDIGTLPYNEYGWATVAFSDLYVPSGGVLNIQLRNAANDANAVLVQITGGSLFVSSANLCPWTVTSRFCLLLHLHEDGRAAYTLINLTLSPLTNKIVFSGPIADWTPQALGKLIYASVPGASANEIGLCAICKWATVSLIDSLTAASYTPGSGGTVAISYSSSVARRFPYGEERQNIPGGHWPHKELGAPRRLVICPSGASGLTRRQWQQFVWSGFDESHGIEFLMVDGGSINDVFAVLASATALTGTLAQLKYNLRRMLQQCAENRNKVWGATMLARTLGAAINTSQNNGGNYRLTTATAHGLNTNNYVTVSGSSGSDVNGGPYSIVAVDSTTQVTINKAYVGDETGGNITATLSTQQESCRTGFNTAIRQAFAELQFEHLFSLSDIAADQDANPGNYLGTLAFWADSTHPLDTTTEPNIYVGAGYVAKRMVELATYPLGPAPRGTVLEA